MSAIGVSRKGPPDAGQNDPLDFFRLAKIEHLKDCVVFGIDRQKRRTAVGDFGQKQLTGTNQALLVGECHRRAALGSGDGWRQTGTADDTGHDPIGGTRRRLNHRFLSGPDIDAGSRQGGLDRRIIVLGGHRHHPRVEFQCLLHQQIRVSVAGDGLDHILVRLPRYEIEGVTADGTG